MKECLVFLCGTFGCHLGFFNAEGDRWENEISKEGVDSACRGGERQRKGGHSLTPHQTWQISKQLTACKINGLSLVWARHLHHSSNNIYQYTALNTIKCSNKILSTIYIFNFNHFFLIKRNYHQVWKWRWIFKLIKDSSPANGNHH